MIVILTVLSIVAQVMQQIFRKEYDKRSNKGEFCFSLVGVFASLIYFIVLTGGNFSFSAEMLLYAIPFSICYTIAYVFTMFSIKNGPLSLTSLIISCSVAVPVIFGVVALKEPVNIALILGVILLFLSVVFVAEPWRKEEMRITVKWIIYSSVTFFSNGFCMSVQKLFQIKDKGVHSNEFMVCSLILTFLSILILVLAKERKSIRNFIKGGGIIWPVLCGAGNGIANQLTMMLAVVLPASFLYPVQSAGAIILTAVISMLFYKERLSLVQKAGFAFGVFAIIAFNI